MPSGCLASTTVVYDPVNFSSTGKGFAVEFQALLTLVEKNVVKAGLNFPPFPRRDVETCIDVIKQATIFISE